MYLHLCTDLCPLCILLQAFESYVKDTTAKLGRKISDLEDVHFIMPVLKEVCGPHCSV